MSPRLELCCDLCTWHRSATVSLQIQGSCHSPRSIHRFTRSLSHRAVADFDLRSKLQTRSTWRGGAFVYILIHSWHLPKKQKTHKTKPNNILKLYKSFPKVSANTAPTYLSAEELWCEKKKRKEKQQRHLRIRLNHYI